MPYQMFVVDWDGTVAPCCGGRNLIMGNCNKNNIYDIWNGEIYQKLRDEVIETKPIYCTCSAIHNSANYSSSDDSQTSNNLQCEYKSIVEKFKSMIEIDIDKAIQLIEQQQIFDFDRNSIILWNELAGVLVHRKKDYLKAQKYIDKILNIDPYNIAAIIKQANIFIYTEKYEDAIIKLSNISEVLKKEYPFINFWLGYAYEMQCKMDLAISCYRLFTDDIEKDSSWGYKHAEEVLSLYDTP